ncbi:hypothetical protein MVES1_003331 [Malassezia vespertilionis]|uniref:uncharacterized protein n=1 Tax=Malassezia vespertilionis TaxID=2020962 RepID=UPI0024B1C3A6|nr:uncharacterized protein MVES1_003331 [Malassezia vespertilionis]WFD07962.1 hypothetical protein MVES1_003331 [Malassezia vespertilionis]
MSAMETFYANLDKEYEENIPFMSEREKCLKGLAFSPLDKELTKMRIDVRKLLHAYNNSPPANFKEDEEPKLEIMGSDRRELLAQIFQLKHGEESRIEIEPPLWLYVTFTKRY